MQRKGSGHKNNWRIWLSRAMPVLFFIFVFLLYFSLLSDPYFPDEQESYVGAYSVIKGKDLYAAYHCQHMPFSYYYAVPLALLGARTVYQFRLGTYLLLSLLWELIYLRHRRAFHPVTLFAMPLLYIAALKPLYMGTDMLADHWQGIGLLIILLEMIRYVDEKTLPPLRSCMIALGISLSLGFSFASAYALFCLFLGAAGIQIAAVRKGLKAHPAQGEERKHFIRQFLREDLLLVALSLLPFVLLLGWYALSGNLENFYISCFENVTQVYAVYIDDVGSDPISVIWTTPRDFLLYLVDLVSGLPGALWPNLLYLLSALCVIPVIVKMIRKSPFAGIMTALAVIYSGLRGFRDFHSMAYQAMTTASLAVCIGWLFQKEWRGRVIPWAVRGVTGLAAAVLLANHVLWAGYNLRYPQILLPRTLRSEERIMALLTEKNEEVFICDLPINSLDLMDLELTPKENSLAIIYPFYYEPWREKLMASIQDLPHVLTYDPETRNEGSAYWEYAPDFDTFVKANYTRLPQAETIWVSNEFLPEAQERLTTAGYGERLSIPFPDAQVHAQELTAGESVTQSFTAEGDQLNAVQIMAACYYRRCCPTLSLRVVDHESGQLMGEAVMTPDMVADNFYSRCPLQATLTPGKTFDLVLTVEKLEGKGSLGLYLTEEDQLPLKLEYLE